MAKKTQSSTTAPKSAVEIEEIVKEIKTPKQPKKQISDLIDNVVNEMTMLMKEHRKDMNTASCANINKAIADLTRVSKNLKR